jgi:hypothetical protein
MEAFSDPDCGTSMSPPLTVVGCFNPNIGGASSVRITAPDEQAAACDAGATKSAPPWSWSDSQRACGPTRILHTGPSGGCPAGQVCVDPPPTLLFTAGLCLYQTGDQSCSNLAAYPHKHASVDAGVDTRDCDSTACACSSSFTCTVNSVNFDISADACGNQNGVYPMSGSSECFHNGVRYVSADVKASTPAPCSVVDEDAAVPIGGIAPTGEWTFCCTQ